MWWKKNKWKVIAPVLILAVLAGVFWLGGDSPGARGWKISKTDPTAQTQTAAPAENTAQETGIQQSAPAEGKDDAPEQNAAAAQSESADGAKEQESAPEKEPEKEPETENPAGSGVPEKATEGEQGAAPQQETEKAPEKAPEKELEAHSEPQPQAQQPEAQTEPQPQVQQPEAQTETQPETQSGETTCTISISCATILNNMSWCPPAKVGLVPADGWILPPTEVVFNEGESVFNVLQRTCKKNKIHMEFSNNPLYDSAYIEGINNIYQFDVGELSGWMYSVNGWFPNYGCSKYSLKDGDVICWVYTCDLGSDVGGGYAVQG